MDLRYEMYVSKDQKYYKPIKLSKKKMGIFKRVELPSLWSYEADESNHWQYCTKARLPIPIQGWKIHISANINNAQETLDKVIPLLIKMNTPFKFVVSKSELFLKNSKYGDRSSSGKFMTIYPLNDSIFENLLIELEKLLKNQEMGPYVLTDNRWKISNIYYRYGGFAEMYTENGELAIVNSMGELIPDRRELEYYIPSFVTRPQLIALEEDKNIDELKESRLDEYEILEPLHFSNGGGVYLAKRISDELKVVIKEGRPGVGLDGLGEDAFSRMERERKALESLRGVNGVANLIDSFISWEHKFIVEEYVEGNSLQTWIAFNFPFHTNELENYSEKAIKIAKKLKKIVFKIHENGIGMGDLTPNNIMIDPNNLNPILIDFEASDEIESDRGFSLHTQGYFTPLARNTKEADLFGLLRILRFLFFPVGPIQDIDINNEAKIDFWIEKKYGKKIINTILEIEKEIFIIFPKLGNFKKNKIVEIATNSNNEFKHADVDVLLTVQKNTRNQIKNGLINEINIKNQLIMHGDIRQYEDSSGKLNVMTGSFGIIMSLIRSGESISFYLDWIDKYSKKKYINKLDNGLFSGKAGIACILLELNMKDKAKEIINLIDILRIKETDISLLSGFSGIGLAFLSFYNEFKDKLYLENANVCADKIISIFERKIPIEVYDEDFISIGLIDGWSGASFFLESLYRITGEKKWLENSKKMMDYDLTHCKNEGGVLLSDDGSRLLPYLSSGTIGMSLPLFMLSQDGYSYSNELKQIKELSNSQCSYNVGLFRGFGGFLLLCNIFNFYGDPISNKKRIDIVNTINTYLVKNKNGLISPGDYGYKLSGDLFSGSSGLLGCFSEDKFESMCSWIPLPIKFMMKILKKEE